MFFFVFIFFLIYTLKYFLKLVSGKGHLLYTSVWEGVLEGRLCLCTSTLDLEEILVFVEY